MTPAATNVLALHMDQPVRRPNARDRAKAETRRKVLDAARFLFLNVGYFQTGIRQIATHAGMSTGAVFNTVQDKEELWREACGGPPPSEQLAEEVAYVLAAFPGWRTSLNSAPDGTWLAGVMSPDWSPIGIGASGRGIGIPPGKAYHGRGDSPGSAVREARIAAERDHGTNGARSWMEATACL